MHLSRVNIYFWTEDRNRKKRSTLLTAKGVPLKNIKCMSSGKHQWAKIDKVFQFQYIKLMSTLTSFSHSKYVMPMIVERAGFVISLSSDSPVAQGDDEWLENHSMYCAWWSIIMEDTNHLYILCSSTKIKLSIPVDFVFICCQKTKTHQHTHEYWPSVNPPIGRLTNWKYGKQTTIPRCPIIVA